MPPNEFSSIWLKQRNMFYFLQCGSNKEICFISFGKILRLIFCDKIFKFSYFGSAWIRDNFVSAGLIRTASSMRRITWLQELLGTRSCRVPAVCLSC